MDDAFKKIIFSQNFTTPSRYISGRICEYDIKSANITMLKQSNMMTQEYYNYLLNLPKIDREIMIGLEIKNNKAIYDAIKLGIQEAKLKFIEANNISIGNIVRIANDAVYINSSIDMRHLIFDDVEFRKKLEASSMIKLKNIIIFSWYINDQINIDVKGISEKNQLLHQNYMLSIIANTIYLCERVSVEEAIKFISGFYEDYINSRVDIEFYRELNAESMFSLKADKDSNSIYEYKVNSISVKNINIINTNYNLDIIRELWSILMSIYRK